MSTGYRLLKITSGELESNPMNLPWDSNLGISHIATVDNVVSNTKIEIWLQSKKDSSVWFPFYNSEKSENAALSLIKNKFIPCVPYVDGRGAEGIKFKLNQTQPNDIILEIGLVRLF